MSQDHHLDLEDVVRKWALAFPLDKEQKKQADDILSPDINWAHMRVRHGRTVYKDQVHATSPKTHVLFTAQFTNNTNQAQTYSLRTERRTTSVCTLSMTKGYSYGASVDIKLTPPNPIIEANVGFKGEMTMERADDNTFEEELVWSVDSQIGVPANFRTKAELVIKEDNYNGRFQAESRFDGKVHVTIRNKHDNTPITTISGDVKNFFTQDQGFRIDNSGIYFVTHGICRCRFGVEQHVKLSQSEIVTGDVESDSIFEAKNEQ